LAGGSSGFPCPSGGDPSGIKISISRAISLSLFTLFPPPPRPLPRNTRLSIYIYIYIYIYGGEGEGREERPAALNVTAAKSRRPCPFAVRRPAIPSLPLPLQPHPPMRCTARRNCHVLILRDRGNYQRMRDPRVSRVINSRVGDRYFLLSSPCACFRTRG